MGAIFLELGLVILLLLLLWRVWPRSGAKQNEDEQER